MQCGSILSVSFMADRTRSRTVAVTIAAWAIALAGTSFCVLQLYWTAQKDAGDRTGMQWVIVTPLAVLFLFVVLPAFATGIRGLRLLRGPEPISESSVVPGRLWIVALLLLLAYLLAPFVVAPLLAPFFDE